MVRASEFSDNADALNSLITRLSGHPKRSLYLIFIGEGATGVPGLSKVTLADLFADVGPTDIFVHAQAEGDADPGLPPTLLRGLLDQNIRSVRQFTSDGAEWPYRLGETGERKVLFVFPGPIFPINMGSHQRAVNMMLALIAHGCDLTVVLSGPSYAARMAALPPLSLLACKTDHYPNRKDLFARWRVQAETKLLDLGRAVGATRAPRRESFGQRVRLRNSVASLRCLKRHEIDSFDVVFVNYAWLLPNVLRRHPRRPPIVCDTHDVQFVRSFSDEAILPDPIRTWQFRRAQRQELRLLGRADLVLAISERDQSVLVKHLPEEKVVLASSSFEHALAPVRLPPAVRPLRFGFFGTRMEANELALADVLTRWWPAIGRWSPESRLFIAGSICGGTSLRQHGYLDDTIEPVGFVPTVAGFYQTVDVLLSPVHMAGGMNFKNAEAIAAGVTLITNGLGAEALGLGEDLRVAETEGDVLAHLQQIETDPQAELARRQRLQDRLMERYRTDPAIERILSAAPA
ncbi:Glycosyltransferase [Rhodovulum sp. P5]|nr:Glycosyltransferase [Rhodovulum sp. P5]